ncbi:MAG TPA: SPOR domain-containing protein [Gemmatimonadota bacterium]|nr:SPOR domain-containing protein [Gemmatimonadota bacterium]
MRRALRTALVSLAVASAACASSRSASPPPPEPRDRTDDPELAAARAAARPEFETQADALAAGVYERFEHPDSVTRAAPAPQGVAAAQPPVVSGGEDPTTEELLGTLGAPGPYNAGAGAPGEMPPDGPASAGEKWTLQLGAFESETGALVRIRQVAAEFPTLPRWYEREGGRVRVFVGRFTDRAEAERERTRLAAAGYSDVWVTPVP